MIVFGHRGARLEAPENTVAGFRHAHDVGMRAVEFDVRLTVDDVVVVIHDRTVDRTSDGCGAVADLTGAQVTALDARAAFPDWPEPCPVPTLGRALDAVEDFDAVAIELKPDAPRRLSVLVPAVVAELERHRAVADRVVLTSFDPVALVLAAEHAPHLRRGLIGDWDSPAALLTARRLDCRQADLNLATARQGDADAARAAGLVVVAWPCNDRAAWDQAAAWGATAVTTDVPSQVASFRG